MKNTLIRAAGVWIDNDHILLESFADRDVWGIPGGGVQRSEMAAEACVREYREELGLEMEARSLALVHENVYRQRGRMMREYGFYFRVAAREEMPPAPFSVESQESQLKFQWWPLERLDELEFVPMEVQEVLPELGESPVFLSSRPVISEPPGIEPPLTFSFSHMDDASAREALSWRYEAPYAVYNTTPEAVEAAVQGMLDPENGYTSLRDDDGELVAFCCFGPDAQVPGGDYGAPALDIGLGVRPDLTGRGLGSQFAEAVLEYAEFRDPRGSFRVTIAEFNTRAQRVWHRAGFRPAEAFARTGDGMPFLILVHDR
jgi:ADP-ribose pyrophosphatase YjhB (NUDIX family)/RimJ/RimL family protein N-acetyltransferase